jgi:hypothetical protein
MAMERHAEDEPSPARRACAKMITAFIVSLLR